MRHIFTALVILCSVSYASASDKSKTEQGFTVSIKLDSTEQVERELTSLKNNSKLNLSGMSHAQLKFSGVTLEEVVKVTESLMDQKINVGAIVTGCTIETSKSGVQYFGGQGSTCTNHVVSGGTVTSYIVRTLQGKDVCMQGEQGRYEADVCDQLVQWRKDRTPMENSTGQGSYTGK